MTGHSIVFQPLIPWIAIAAASAVLLAIIGYGFYRRAAGTPARAAAALLLVLALAGPTLVTEQRQPQKDVALLVEDVSPSQGIGQRRRQADRILADLQHRLSAMSDLEVRTIEAGAPSLTALKDTGTELIGPIGRALADVPAERIAGIAVITDGQVHDVPASNRLPVEAPLHVLLDGDRHEADRRIVVTQAPSFGIVGKPLALTLRVEDLGSPTAEDATTRVTVRRDGGSEQVLAVPVGQDTEVPITLDHGGQTVVEVAAEPGPHELTLDNNRAAVVVHGVRDRLKVLLVSGEPHAGERTWRNLLKADPSVDLVHFTILRPPEKQDGTPIRELSLIAFPVRELFDVKLDDFDLIIFDRYQRRGVLPQTYLENISRYVRNGGALLEASGSSFGTAGSLYRTPLGAVLPAEPTGEVFEQGFKPRVTALGLRHPVTAGLSGSAASADADPSWGRWFRQVEATPHQGDVVMSGVDGKPLLVLDRVGKGRVAQLLSDQMWLWTRGFEGGGPQAELLRRLSYWLMKEPDLEENDLHGEVAGRQLTVTRRTLEPDQQPVALTRPDGRTETLALKPEGGGVEAAAVPVAESGLYRMTDGTRTALAAVGALNPVEFSDVRTTADRLQKLADLSGGGVSWVGPDQPMPEIRRIAPDRAAAGNGWIGFRANRDYIVTGLAETDLLPPWLALLLTIGSLLLGWYREGGGRSAGAPVR